MCMCLGLSLFGGSFQHGIKGPLSPSAHPWNVLHTPMWRPSMGSKEPLLWLHLGPSILCPICLLQLRDSSVNCLLPSLHLKPASWKTDVSVIVKKKKIIQTLCYLGLKILVPFVQHCVCSSFFFIPVTKHLTKEQHYRRDFTVAHSLEEYSLLWWGRHPGSNSLVCSADQKAEKGNAHAKPAFCFFTFY